MLVAPEVDGHLQLMPFVHQPEALNFKAGVDVHEFFPKLAQRTHRLPVELVADTTPLARELKRMTRPVPRAGSR